MNARSWAPLLGFLCALGAASVETGAQNKSVVIVEAGRPAATIVVSADAGEKPKTAAAELQATVAKMSGATLPVVTDSTKPSGRLILVGRSTLTDAMKAPVPSGLTGGRREEGYLLLCRGDRIVLAGNDSGPYHGTEYAVYDFLQRQGVRWYMPGDYGEIVPKRDTIAFPEMRVISKPDFIMRNWWVHALPELADQERKWKLRNRLNPDPMFAIPGDSSARNILPESKYFKEHPEYFALNADGTRNPFLPNLTSPKAVEIAAEIVKEHFRANPGANSYGFAPDDGLPRDYNPETMKRNLGIVSMSGRPGVPAEVSTTEEWLAFVHAVATEVHKAYPDAYIATNGYANRDIAPQGVKLDDRLVTMFAAIWSCTLHPYDDDRCWMKVRQGQMLRRWTAACKNVWLYNYQYQMLVSALTPLPETRKLRRDFPLWKRWDVIGFNDEARNQWMENGIASRYLRARLEWDAGADVDQILAEFYRDWYGAAARPMQAHSDAIEDAIQSAQAHGHEDRILPEIYTPQLVAKLDALVKEAETLADTDRARTHVRADRLITDHLARYVEMSAAELSLDYAKAARCAAEMQELRRKLHAIHPFYVWSDETRYHGGVWYWGLAERRKWYEEQSDRLTGKSGKLLVALPQRTAFRTDPRDEGFHSGWYEPGAAGVDWTSVDTFRPFYLQGHCDAQGYPYTGIVWYRWTLAGPRLTAGKRVILVVPTVTTEAWCWVNGKFVGYRPYLEAYVRPCAMEFDVTDALGSGGASTIAIRVNTSLQASQMSEGILGRPYLYSPN